MDVSIVSSSGVMAELNTKQSSLSNALDALDREAESLDESIGRLLDKLDPLMWIKEKPVDPSDGLPDERKSVSAVTERIESAVRRINRMNIVLNDLAYRLDV